MGRLLSGIARQLELPLFDRGTGDTPTPAGPEVDTPRVVPGGAKLRHIRLGERVLACAFRRGRRKTIGFSIGPGGLAVAAPRWVGIGQVEDAIREREAWILEKLAHMQRREAAIPRVRWEDGGTLPYLGEPITLRMSPAAGRGPGIVLDPATRTLRLGLRPDATTQQIKDRVEAWLQSEARTLFRERLAIYEGRLGVAHRVLRLSSARTRWGSCNANGRILLNWRLIHFPLSSIDYVVAHELAHLKEMNHGPRFWATVAEAMPDYETARSLMKNPPPELLPAL